MTDEYKELFSRQPGHHKQRILYKATPTVQTVDVARCAEQRQAPQKIRHFKAVQHQFEYIQVAQNGNEKNTDAI